MCSSKLLFFTAYFFLYQLFTRNLVTQPIKEEEDVDLLEEDKLELAPVGGPELPT